MLVSAVERDRFFAGLAMPANATTTFFVLAIDVPVLEPPLGVFSLLEHLCLQLLVLLDD